MGDNKAVYMGVSGQEAQPYLDSEGQTIKSSEENVRRRMKVVHQETRGGEGCIARKYTACKQIPINCINQLRGWPKPASWSCSFALLVKRLEPITRWIISRLYCFNYAIISAVVGPV